MTPDILVPYRGPCSKKIIILLSRLWDLCQENPWSDHALNTDANLTFCERIDTLFININVISFVFPRRQPASENQGSIFLGSQVTQDRVFPEREAQDQSFGVAGSLKPVNKVIVWQENSTRQRKTRLNLGISWLHKQQQNSDFRENSVSKESVRP